MDSNIKHIVENFFDNTDINKLAKKNSINVNDSIYKDIKIGDPLYYKNGQFTIFSEHKYGYIAKCVMTADETLYKRPVFMLKHDLYGFDSYKVPGDYDILQQYSWTPIKEYYNFNYYTPIEAEKDMNGWDNTEQQYKHQCDYKNAKYQNGYKDSTIINTVKAYHKQAYIGSLGEWILIRKNILQNSGLFREFIEKTSYYWTSTMRSYDYVYRFEFDEKYTKFSKMSDAVGMYNTFRVRPLILL